MIGEVTGGGFRQWAREPARDFRPPSAAERVD
jgi:hypothetical protein